MSVPISNSSSTFAGSLTSDPAYQKAVALGATSLLQDIVKGKSLEWKKAFVLGAADATALKYIKGYFFGTISQYTGEMTWSDLLAEAAALALVLFVSSYLGLTSRGDSAEGLVGAPNIGSSKLANASEAVLDASILLVERNIALFAAGKMGITY